MESLQAIQASPQKPKKIDLKNRFKDEEHDSIGAVTFKHKHSNQSKDNSIQNEKFLDILGFGIGL